MKRRHFLELGAAIAALSARNSGAKNAKNPPRDAVDFLNDGRALSPGDYARLLMRMADEGRIRADYYSNGGVVEELENRMAKHLGHEAAVFMPTGTLANHIAVRKLAGDKRRVLVPAESHLYRDSGDCAQALSNLNLVPLAPGQLCYSVEALVEAIRQARDGRVATPVGALLVETPVRRMHGRAVEHAELDAITTAARQREVKTHLDGARVFIQAVHADTQPAAFGQLFDTVYTSLWKCFNAPSGAILAGSKVFCAGLFQERRMFGGGLPHAWPFAAVALYYLDGFMDDYRAALKRARALFSAINEEGLVSENLPGGTHIVRATLQTGNALKFREALAQRHVAVPEPDNNVFYFKINPTLNDAADLESRFSDALKHS